MDHLFEQKYLEHFAAEGDFTFEPGMIIVQPFIRSTMSVQSENLYLSVRSIICNGQFVDAYARVSPDPVSNLARSALAVPFEHPEVKTFSEKAIQVYERESTSHSETTFQSQIYGSYFAEKGMRIPQGNLLLPSGLAGMVMRLRDHFQEL